MKPGDRERAAAAFGSAEVVLLAFPLYTDAMPGVVKEFIERLAPYRKRQGNARILFLVQSGFPEGGHTKPVARYLEKLAQRLGCEYLGTIRKGGVEGIQGQPASMTRKLFAAFHDIGRRFGETGLLDRETLEKLAGRDRFPKWMLAIGCWMSRRMYWDPTLRANSVYERRWARPYEVGTKPS